MSLTRIAQILLIPTLAACTAGIDRHGRPIDAWKPITRETSPDPGPVPTKEQALAAIKAEWAGSDIKIEDKPLREGWYNQGAVYSGWLVCYELTTKSIFGINVIPNKSALVRKQPDGGFTAFLGPRLAQDPRCN